MSKKYMHALITGLLVHCFSAYALSQDIFNQEMPGKISETQDPDIARVEKRMTLLLTLLKKAEENNDQNLIRNIEITLKTLIKQRNLKIKDLEKKGMVAIVNRSLDNIPWRIKQHAQEENQKNDL